ncbi:hypothetical protein [Mesorhizobium sp. CN2-181]|uniref:hypothetical protein n=1 Tax=Mesorhizobium yinganensis TaxID=3157707 RepID=UPI0032B77E50
MNALKQVGILVAAVIILGGSGAFSEHLSIQGALGFVSTAEAKVGRPLTPVSVAGVARRSARRCATGVYNC